MFGLFAVLNPKYYVFYKLSDFLVVGLGQKISLRSPDNNMYYKCEYYSLPHMLQEVHNTVCLESRCELKLRYIDLFVIICSVSWTLTHA
jgi:hypothetical protein